MTILFFSDKPRCGKSTLTILTAKALLNLFERGDGDRKIYIFDSAMNIENSLAFKKKQEENQIKPDENLIVEYVDNFEDYKIKKIELGIKDNDIVFFDLQDFGEKQYDFICNTDYIFVVSDNPNELERIDKDMYFLFEKLKNNPNQSISQIKKVFLTQNRVSKSRSEEAVFENINYMEGLDELNEIWKIEKIQINKKASPPMNIQKFALEIWKKINEFQEQVIL